MTGRERLREIVLWVGAVLGVLCILWTIVMFAFGLTPLVFTSGSMSPAIKAGDLAFAETIDADEIEVEDILSVVNEKGVRITHRVVRVDPTDDGAVVVLKGDANSEPDVEPYAVTTAERVLFHVPKAGYVVDAAGSPIGMFVGGLLAAAALFVAFGGRGGGGGGGSVAKAQEDAGSTEEVAGDGSAAKRNRHTFLIGPVVLVLGMMVAVQPAQAAFTDTATMTSGTFTAAALPIRPSSITCVRTGIVGFRVATVSWADDSPRYGYYYEIAQEPDWSGSDKVTGVIQPTGTNSVEFSGATSGGWFTARDYYIRVYSAYVTSAGAVTWRSSSYRAYSVARTFGTVSYDCGSNISPAN
ncbi:signal peptidase I [Aeromicrobium choanae]|uniref:Signal peptidase I n=1 Tax=Aeromicrobium choanae TaxID=1736691 RepID=A0A1T4Z7E2_9ACTN|nr:signal peptidase I [Aeromicrobium choanae]SKB09942.1 signal peptidase I [Aeromicrobium choanae]